MRYSLPLFVLVILGILLLPGSNAQYGILASPDKIAYNPGQMVILNAFIPEESQVTFQVVDPNGNIMFVKSTDSFPSLEVEPSLVEEARVGFKLNDEAVIGFYTYYISAISDNGSENAMVSGSFEVTEDTIDETDSSFIPFVPVPLVAGSLVVVGFFRKLMAN